QKCRQPQQKMHGNFLIREVNLKPCLPEPVEGYRFRQAQPNIIMNTKTILVNTASPEKARSKILIIYTGGTFGMAHDKEGVLIPFDFELILEHLPTLRTMSLELTVVSFEHPIDSSNINPEHWQLLAQIISDHYNTHEGFVILHGTDTMAYTASALSFMLEGL